MVNISTLKAAPIVLAVTAASLWLSGCSGSKAAAAPPKDALANLGIVDVKVGDGGEFGKKTPAQKGDVIAVMYTGTLKDGTVFDSNDKANRDPYFLNLGAGDVIKGWDEGIVGMKVGGERKLSIPSRLAYGEHAKAKIPAYSDLYFDIKLLDVTHPGQDRDVIPNDLKVGTGPVYVPNKSKVTLKYWVKDINHAELDSRTITVDLAKETLRPAIALGLTGMKEGGIRDLYLAQNIALPSQVHDNLTDTDGPPGQYVHIELLKVQ